MNFKMQVPPHLLGKFYKVILKKITLTKVANAVNCAVVHEYDPIVFIQFWMSDNVDNCDVDNEETASDMLIIELHVRVVTWCFKIYEMI